MARIKLTENVLKDIIKESIKGVLSELDWKTYANAGKKAEDTRTANKYPYMSESIDRVVKENINKFLSEALNRKRNYNIDLALKNDIAACLSDIGFGLNMRLVQERYPFVSNVGYEDKERVITHIINSCPFNGNKIAQALNNSDVSFTDWNVEKETSKTITLVGNRGWYRLYISK